MNNKQTENYRDLTSMCVKTGKKRYRFCEAKRDAKILRRRFHEHHIPYRCEYCQHFHVGSDPYRRQQRLQTRRTK